MQVRKLYLSCFRNHQQFAVDEIHDVNIIIGPNGSGKTSLLEAISMLIPGRGMRSCKPEEVLNHNQSTFKQWAVNATLANDNELATGFETVNNKRLFRIDNEPIKRQADVLALLRVVWLTPQMCTLFFEGNTARRKFIDRICYSFYPDHSTLINKLDYHIRSRNTLLSQPHCDQTWLTSIEYQIALLSQEIHNKRLQAINYMQQEADKYELHHNHCFPKIQLCNENLTGRDAEAIALLLAQSRHKDQATGRTSIGAHRDELLFYHPDKATEAKHCSTGEQKSMLTAIVLAQVYVIKDIFKISPILLLDEIFAHFDRTKSEALVTALQKSPMQVWITTTNPEIQSLFTNPNVITLEG
jgi:DNA replication and repair protein RecF